MCDTPDAANLSGSLVRNRSINVFEPGAKTKQEEKNESVALTEHFNFFFILTKLVLLITNRLVSRNVRVRETKRLFTISWGLNVIFVLNASGCVASQLFFLSPSFYILSHILDFANTPQKTIKLIFVRKTISKFCFLNNLSAFFCWKVIILFLKIKDRYSGDSLLNSKTKKKIWPFGY